VLSLRNPPELVGAVRSLVDQAEDIEVVVVNSGGGDPEPRLRGAGLDVRVVNRSELLLPGAARNVGIDAIGARYVSFLASDCRAEPGWATARLRHHRDGADAVASVITNPGPDTLSSRASHLLLHPRRLDETASEDRVLYGLSYDRGLFERFGRFREDVRHGEDSDFNARIESAARIIWASDVRTSHMNPTTPTALVADQFARGRRARIYGQLSTLRLIRVGLLKEPLYSLAQARRAGDPLERRRLVAAAPLLFVGSAAHLAGVLWSRFRAALRGGARRGGTPRSRE
jgi:glycosyltransferase involved in cell wall biosynthesis